MSIEAQAWAKKQKVGSLAMKAILLELANRANEHGECFPGHKLLCETLEIPRRTLQRRLNDLVEKGFISITPQVRKNDRGKTSNLYTLNFKGTVLFKSDDDFPADQHEETPNAAVAHSANVAHGYAPVNGAPHASPVGATNNNQSNNNTSEEVLSDEFVSEEFELFWSAFPRKEDRAAALKLFSSIVRTNEVTSRRLVAAAAAYALQKEGVEQRWLKMPSTWLSAKGWLDHSPTRASPDVAMTYEFPGPPELRATLLKKLGEGWVKSYLDPADWLSDVSSIVPRTSYAESVIRRDAMAVLAAAGYALAQARVRPS